MAGSFADDSDCGVDEVCEQGSCVCDPNSNNCPDMVCDPMNPDDPDCVCNDPNDPNCP